MFRQRRRISDEHFMKARQVATPGGSRRKRQLAYWRSGQCNFTNNSCRVGNKFRTRRMGAYFSSLLNAFATAFSANAASPFPIPCRFSACVAERWKGWGISWRQAAKQQLAAKPAGLRHKSWSRRNNDG